MGVVIHKDGSKSPIPRGFRSRPDRIGICKRCGLKINDSEPAAPFGEFWHKESKHKSCINERMRLTLDSGEVLDFVSKRSRRATKRGAKLASKLRPR